jgi:hypothetical protein
MRFRFSIRSLLLLFALVAAFCYWWIARPSLFVHRFDAAVERGDFAAADAMIHPESERFLADWAEKRWAFRAHANVEPVTFSDLCRGRRPFQLTVSTFEFDQTVARVFQYVATPTGIDIRRNSEMKESRTPISIGIESRPSRPQPDQFQPTPPIQRIPDNPDRND